MGAADGLGTRLGEPKVMHLSLINKILDGTRYLLNRDVGINAVLVEQVNPVGAQPLQRFLCNLANILRAAIKAITGPSVFKPELGCNDDLVADGGKRLTKQFLIIARPVGFGGVEEGNAEINGVTEQRDRFVLSVAGP